MANTAKQKTSDTRFLQRIGSRWHARIPVPNKLRPALGPYLRKSLDTSDLGEAQRRRWDFLEVARRRFEAKERELRLAPPKPRQAVPDNYAAFRAKLDTLGPAYVVIDEEEGEEPNPALAGYVEDLEQRGRMNADMDAALSDHVRGTEPVSKLLDDYLAKNPKRSETTAANYQTTVKLWIAHHGDRSLNRVTRREALEWIESVGEGKARDTVKRYVTVMGHLWDWAWRKEDDPPANPFSKLQKAAGKTGRAAAGYAVFDADELLRVFAALSGDDELRSVSLISIYSGMRLSECLSAKRHLVEGVECFELEGGKTNNAARLIPVHPRLVEVRAPEGVKASALSVRFGRLLRPLGLPEGKTFHSLRKCFATALERSGCPEPIAVRLLGHAPVSMSYRVYSKGREVAELRGWVENISFNLCQRSPAHR